MKTSYIALASLLSLVVVAHSATSCSSSCLTCSSSSIFYNYCAKCASGYYYHIDFDLGGSAPCTSTCLGGNIDSSKTEYGSLGTCSFSSTDNSAVGLATSILIVVIVIPIILFFIIAICVIYIVHKNTRRVRYQQRTHTTFNSLPVMDRIQYPSYQQQQGISNNQWITNSSKWASSNHQLHKNSQSSN